MSDEPPTPPAEFSTEFLDILDDYSPERLREVANYVEDLAEYRERKARLADTDENTQVEERPANRPDDVPSKATITVKEINDNRYYYWQWRDGERVRSKYKGPVDSES